MQRTVWRSCCRAPDAVTTDQTLTAQMPAAAARTRTREAAVVLTAAGVTPRAMADRSRAAAKALRAKAAVARAGATISSVRRVWLRPDRDASDPARAAADLIRVQEMPALPM